MTPLLLQLKDAGFMPHKAGAFDIIYDPTLEELFEELGDRFEELNRMGHGDKEPKWIATSYPCEECGWKEMLNSYGKTPKEALIKLYIAINKK